MVFKVTYLASEPAAFCAPARMMVSLSTTLEILTVAPPVARFFADLEVAVLGGGWCRALSFGGGFGHGWCGDGGRGRGVAAVATAVGDDASADDGGSGTDDGRVGVLS
ncbi:hypothetical protein ACIBAG_28250 [Streptomyces sp. NPDC051243]|uniref:hypothetical protein n=1 Tax=Streptomyces sp. NPDC051243 TaxID=3365646 RepID=UPI00379F6A4C